MGFAETLVKVIFWPRVRKARRIGEAAALIGEGRAEETLEILRTMERRIPPYLGHLFFLTRARALDELGRLEEAEQTYLAAVIARQGASKAHLHLAVLCGRQRRFDDARDWIRRLREDEQVEQDLAGQAEQLVALLDEVESGERQEQMRARARRFAAAREVDALPVEAALARLDTWVSEDLQHATDERDDLACFLGELALCELGARWIISLSLEESFVVAGDRELHPFQWVADRLAGGSPLAEFLAAPDHRA